MNCCTRCFKDPEIKAIIKGNNIIGNCDFCQNTNVNVCMVNDEN